MNGEPWFFFGCEKDSGRGHCLYSPNGIAYNHPFTGFDKSLCVHNYRLFEAAFTRLYNHGYSALAFWDTTGDSRPGSNSIIFAPTLTATPQDILDGARKKFPSFAAHLRNVDLTRAIKIYQEVMAHG